MSHLAQRTAAAAHADFFLSIHHDSVQPYLIETWEHDRVERSFSDLHSVFAVHLAQEPVALAQSRLRLAIGERCGRRFSLRSITRSIPGRTNRLRTQNGVHYYDNLIVLKTARRRGAPRAA